MVVMRFRIAGNCMTLLFTANPHYQIQTLLTAHPQPKKIYVHRSDLSWFETETNWSTIYAQGKIVAAADYLDHLISIGIDVTEFEDEVIA